MYRLKLSEAQSPIAMMLFVWPGLTQMRMWLLLFLAHGVQIPVGAD